MTVSCSPETSPAPDSTANGKPTLSKAIQLPWGLIGFERITGALVVSSPELEPFQWLAFAADSDQAGFLVMDPRHLDRTFELDVEESDCDLLELGQAEAAHVLVVVTLLPGQPPTANLRGPILGNRVTGVYRQIIPRNAGDLPLRHPLLPLPWDETHSC